jgi:hypothetical protein
MLTALDLEITSTVPLTVNALIALIVLCAQVDKMLFAIQKRDTHANNATYIANVTNLVRKFVKMEPARGRDMEESNVKQKDVGGSIYYIMMTFMKMMLKTTLILMNLKKIMEWNTMMIQNHFMTKKGINFKFKEIKD